MTDIREVVTRVICEDGRELPDMKRRERATTTGLVGSVGSAGLVGLELWRLAKRWRRRADAALSPLRLTLMHWWILDATRMLMLDTGDAVSQAAVAFRLEMDKMTLSHAMLALERRGLVDRRPDMTGRAYRIIVTSSGEGAWRQGGALVEATSRTVFGRRWDRLGAALGLETR